MIPDQLLRLADAQSLNATLDQSVASTNVVDIDTLRNIGVGTPLYVRIRFDAAYTQSAGGANAVLVYADDAAITSNVVTLAQLSFGNAAKPPAGTVVYMLIPPFARNASVTATLTQSASIPNNSKKYLGILWQTYSGAITGTGTWTVDIVTEVNMVEHTYTKGFAVQ